MCKDTVINFDQSCKVSCRLSDRHGCGSRDKGGLNAWKHRQYKHIANDQHHRYHIGISWRKWAALYWTGNQPICFSSMPESQVTGQVFPKVWLVRRDLPTTLLWKGWPRPSLPTHWISPWFPPAQAVEGIKFVPSVHLCVCHSALSGLNRLTYGLKTR